MKVFVISLFVLFALIQDGFTADDLAKLLLETKDKCLKSQTYVDPEALERKAFDTVVDETNQDMIDFNYCYSQALDVLNQDGSINDEKIKQLFKVFLEHRFADTEYAAKAQDLADRGYKQCQVKLDKNDFRKTAVIFRNCVLSFVENNKN